MGRSIKTIFKISILIILCSPLFAFGMEVGLVVESKSQQAISFQEQLQKLSPNHKIQLISADSFPSPDKTQSINTWLAMGPKALAVLLGRSNGKDRVLGLFVREKALEKTEKALSSQELLYSREHAHIRSSACSY